MPAAVKIAIEFPDKLAFLFKPAAYKVLWGGRDGVKSWSIAQALLLMATQRPLRILCARETQQSIRESVHQLLDEQIKRLGLSECYEVLQSTIRGRNGSEFIFVGLQNLSVTQIKSFESIDIAWVEEAQVVSKRSWSILLPTIRKSGSEIWVSFNPDLDTDDTYRRWIINPPPGAIVVKTSWHDNRWLSEESRSKIEFLRETDPESFEHIYEGICRSSVSGAIYGNELRRAELEHRLTHVPPEQRLPVDTAWDLGFGDQTCCWIFQRIVSEIRLLDCITGSQKPIKAYMQELQSRDYLLGTHYLPWDGGAQSLGTGISIEEIMRGAGWKVKVLPQLSVFDGLNAVRTRFPQFWFDAEKCTDGIQALRHYQWGAPTKNGNERRQPLHDWASHFADALRTLAMGAKEAQQSKQQQVDADPLAYLNLHHRAPAYAPFG